MGRAMQDVDVWLEPFLAALGHKKRRLWAPLYLRGLLGPSERTDCSKPRQSRGFGRRAAFRIEARCLPMEPAPLGRLRPQHQLEHQLVPKLSCFVAKISKADGTTLDRLQAGLD
jgi:hypothetical protein